jgi:hypothetical protein
MTTCRATDADHPPRENLMLVEALAALAAATGSAVVAAMATDAWRATRDGVAKLFGHGGPQQRSRIEAQMDADAALVEQASDPMQVRQGLAPSWQEEMARLLEEHPEVEPQLRELVARVQETLPAEQKHWVQSNIARDNATQFNVQGGKQEIHYHGPDPRPSDSEPR